MTILVAGTMRAPPENLPSLRLHAAPVLEATRAEDGCITYSFAEDVSEPGLIRVFEVWRDQAALDAHLKTPHLAAWRAASAELGLFDRRLSIYEVAAERTL